MSQGMGLGPHKESQCWAPSALTVVINVVFAQGRIQFVATQLTIITTDWVNHLTIIPTVWVIWEAGALLRRPLELVQHEEGVKVPQLRPSD